ncbi:MAG: hypothetical protein NPIRA03_10140 [Nitrospirales bacterium]|nr:MAG: hypothetical protein NPIRA03_10140 [Nitrospirales bacterium]
MMGRGRVIDNSFKQRLWSTVKYEDIYLHDYRNVVDLKRGKHVYTKVVESVSAEKLMLHIKAKTRKGLVYYTDVF